MHSHHIHTHRVHTHTEIEKKIVINHSEEFCYLILLYLYTHPAVLTDQKKTVYDLTTHSYAYIACGYLNIHTTITNTIINKCIMQVSEALLVIVSRLMMVLAVDVAGTIHSV